MVKILIIRDKAETDDIIACLKSNGFSVEAVDAEQVTRTQLRRKACALIICEYAALTNKEIDAFLQNRNTPILWIVEQESMPVEIRSFQMGLEDYIVLPSGAAEVLARVQMLLRCAGINTGRKLTVGDLYLDADARAAIVKDEEIPLTMREFNLLFGLLSEPDKVFSRKELMQKYWDENSKTGQRAVDVYVTKLREKFVNCKGFQIVTVHGVGYKAVLTNEEAS